MKPLYPLVLETLVAARRLPPFASRRANSLAALAGAKTMGSAQKLRTVRQREIAVRQNEELMSGKLVCGLRRCLLIFRRQAQVLRCRLHAGEMYGAEAGS